MLRSILSIAGKPGLYRLVSRGNNMLIIESITTGKRTPAYASDQVLSLGEISMYTYENEAPLGEVLAKISEKENGQKASVSPKASAAQLHEFFAEVLPQYDRDRVHTSDIKKLITWYNILVEAGIINFAPELTEEAETENEGNDTAEQ